MESSKPAGAPRVVAIVQARMGSSRLPGKVLREAGGRTLLAHVVARLRRARWLDDVVVATTTAPADDELVAAAARLGVPVHRGSQDDVLDRYHGAASAAGADVVVRITADCPLMDPAEVDRVVGAFFAGGGTADLDYVSNQAGVVRRIPHGLDVEVFSRAALDRAWREATAPGEREHVTPYLYRPDTGFRRQVAHKPGADWSHLRLTVDTPEDLALVQRVVEALGPDADAATVVAWLDAHPEVLALNAAIRQRSVASEGELRRHRVAGRLLLGRADGGAALGYGHVARLGALLDAWVEAGGRAALFGSGIGGAFRQRLVDLGIEAVDRDPALAAGSDADRQQTLETALSRDAVAVAVDGYAFEPDFQAALQLRLPLLAVDDLAAFAPVADVIVNQNLGFDPARYGAAPGRLLVGAPYVLLRRDLRQPPEPARDPAAPRVLVTFGGSDPARLTLPVTQALLAGLPANVEVVVLAGGGMAVADRQGLETLAAAHPGRLRVLADVRDVAALFVTVDVAATAAGSTVWELLRCGVAVLAVVVADNQQAVAAGVQAHEAGLALGTAAGVDAASHAASVVDAARALVQDPDRRRGLAERGRALVDGRGVWRVLDALLDAIDDRAVPAQLPARRVQSD